MNLSRQKRRFTIWSANNLLHECPSPPPLPNQPMQVRLSAVVERSDVEEVQVRGDWDGLVHAVATGALQDTRNRGTN